MGVLERARDGAAAAAAAGMPPPSAGLDDSRSRHLPAPGTFSSGPALACGFGALQKGFASRYLHRSLLLLLLGLPSCQGLLFPPGLERSLLLHLLPLLLALCLELGHLFLLRFLALLLLLLFASCALLGLPKLPLLFFPLPLLAELAIAVLLHAGRNLLLELPLGIAAALVKLVAATILKVGPEALIQGETGG